MAIFKKSKKETPKKAPAVKKLVPKFRPGLALGGGGTRGFAHVGVLRAFEESGIDFPIVAGTSAGSIVGALYAMDIPYKEMLEMVTLINEKEIRTSKLFFRPSPSENVETLMRKFVGEAGFADLKRKLSVVAVDLASGEETVFDDGDLCKCVSASCAVPFVFTPVTIEGRRYIDGGLANVVPADVVRLMGAEVVVSVDINSTRGTGTESAKMLDTFFAVFRIASKATAYKCIVNSDIIIKPNLTSFKSTKLDDFDKMIEEGYNAAMEQMGAIKTLLGLKK